MARVRRLSLDRERLAELGAAELRALAGGEALTHADEMSACGHPCFTEGGVCDLTWPPKECLATIG